MSQKLRPTNKPWGHIYGAKLEGQLVEARVVWVRVGRVPAGWWCAALEGQERLAVEVWLGSHPHYFDNDGGAAVTALTINQGRLSRDRLRELPVADVLAPEGHVHVFYR